MENEIKLVEILLLSPVENISCAGVCYLDWIVFHPVRFRRSYKSELAIAVESIKSELTTIYLNKVVLKTLLKQRLGTGREETRPRPLHNIIL